LEWVELADRDSLWDTDDDCDWVSESEGDIDRDIEEDRERDVDWQLRQSVGGKVPSQKGVVKLRNPPPAPCIDHIDTKKGTPSVAFDTTNHSKRAVSVSAVV
jgi:hypothetical protein